MADCSVALILHPTYAALRQWQQRRLAAAEFVETRSHLSVADFFGRCATAAQLAGLLQNNSNPLAPMSDLDAAACRHAAIARWRTQKSPAGYLALLSDIAVAAAFARWLEYLDPLPAHIENALSLLEKMSPQHRQFVEIYQCFQEIAHQHGLATAPETNAAILRLLENDKKLWPECLRNAQRVQLLAIRWIPPFLEQVLTRLTDKLGKEQIEIRYVLAEHEQEWWGRHLLTHVGQAVFEDSRTADDERWQTFYSAQDCAQIETLLNLREGLAMEDAHLAEKARPHVAFSTSVGIYGEVEDMARRIVWAANRRPNPLRYERIAFVARNLADYADPVSNVFQRFGIPFYFRRGTPLRLTPPAQAILKLTRFSATQERDLFTDLLRSPCLDWPAALGIQFDPHRLATLVETQGVEQIVRFEDMRRRLTGMPAALPASALEQLFQLAIGYTKPENLAETLADLMTRCAKLQLAQKLTAAATTTLGWQNQRAYAVLTEIFAALKARHGDAPGNWPDTVHLLGDVLSDFTVPDPVATDGVWILTPFDIVGLDFDMVLVAGLNAGVFPIPQTPDAIFSDHDLEHLRKKLAEKGAGLPPVPAAALPTSAARHNQENLLFLSVLAAARQKLVFSYVSRDENGNPVMPSIYFQMLWRLVGWPAFDKMPAEPPDEYDRWRLQTAPEIFASQWKSAQTTEPFQRRPFQGESFHGILPLELCCAADEARQSVAARNDTRKAASNSSCPPTTPDIQTHHGLTVEMLRNSTLDGKETNRGGRYCGHLSRDRIKPHLDRSQATSTTLSVNALKTLLNCPYRFYLENILNLQSIQPQTFESDMRDMGQIIHEILRQGFSFLRGEKQLLDFVDTKRSKQFSDLPPPRWLVQHNEGWQLANKRDREKTSLPAACLEPKAADQYYAFFDALCTVMEDAWRNGKTAPTTQQRRGANVWRMGLPSVAKIEWQRVRDGVHAILNAQLEAEKETDKLRGTILLEHRFGDTNAPSPAVLLPDPKLPQRTIAITGRIDRVDVLCSKTAPHELLEIHVLDYKHNAADRTKAGKLARAIAEGNDCQMPIYALAAAAYFHADALEKVHMGYLSYKSNAENYALTKPSKLLTLSGKPLEKEELQELYLTPYKNILEAFTVRVFEALQRAEIADFRPTPLDCKYCLFDDICRTVNETEETAEDEGSST